MFACYFEVTTAIYVLCGVQLLPVYGYYVDMFHILGSGMDRNATICLSA